MLYCQAKSTLYQRWREKKVQNCVSSAIQLILCIAFYLHRQWGLSKGNDGLWKRENVEIFLSKIVQTFLRVFFCRTDSSSKWRRVNIQQLWALKTPRNPFEWRISDSRLCLFLFYLRREFFSRETRDISLFFHVHLKQFNSW